MKALASCHTRRHPRFAPTWPLLLGHGPDRRHARRLGLVVCSFGISRGVRVEGVVLLRKATRRFGTVVASILARERKASNPGTNVQGPGRWESSPRRKKNPGYQETDFFATRRRQPARPARRRAPTSPRNHIDRRRRLPACSHEVRISACIPY